MYENDSISRGALLEKLDRHIASMRHGHKSKKYFKGLRDAQRLIEQASAADGWVSIEERLPVCSGSYFICTKLGAVCTAKYYEPTDTHPGYFNGTAGRNATYWMELPKPAGKGAMNDARYNDT